MMKLDTISDSNRTSNPAAQTALRDAEMHLRGSLRSSEPDGDEEWDRNEKEWAALLHWAEERQLILPPDMQGPERKGGREHDVRFDPVSGRWWKYTKPGMSGYTVSWASDEPFLHNASPLDYLLRLSYQNEIFGDDIRLEGLWEGSCRRWSIVTSQPHVAGAPPLLDEIALAFEQLDFEKLHYHCVGYEGSLAYRKDGYDVWDVHPGNVRLSQLGLPIPFDFIITVSPGVMDRD
jgi:hypothetical protein